MANQMKDLSHGKSRKLYWSKRNPSVHEKTCTTSLGQHIVTLENRQDDENGSVMVNFPCSDTSRFLHQYCDIPKEVMLSRIEKCSTANEATLEAIRLRRWNSDEQPLLVTSLKTIGMQIITIIPKRADSLWNGSMVPYDGNFQIISTSPTSKEHWSNNFPNSCSGYRAKILWNERKWQTNDKEVTTSTCQWTQLIHSKSCRLHQFLPGTFLEHTCLVASLARTYPVFR